MVEHNRLRDAAVTLLQLPGDRLSADTIVVAFGHGNRVAVAEIVEMDSIRLPRAESSKGGDGTDAECKRPDLQRDIARAGGRDGNEERRQKRGQRCPDI